MVRREDNDDDDYDDDDNGLAAVPGASNGDGPMIIICAGDDEYYYLCVCCCYVLPVPEWGLDWRRWFFFRTAHATHTHLLQHTPPPHRAAHNVLPLEDR